MRRMIDQGHYGRKMYKERMTETMDTIIMDSIGKSEFDDFKEYEEEMSDFTFKSIFGGG